MSGSLPSSARPLQSPASSAAVAPAKAGAQVPSIRDDYLRATDLRAFVEAHRHRVRDPETAYYVSQALEECALSHDTGSRDGLPDEERRAAALIADLCRGFENEVIDPAAVMDLLRHAARWGEPRAEARLLLLRDVAAPKDDALPLLPWMLTLREPSIVRDVGAFLSRGDAQWRYGGESIPTAVAAIAWELVACDLDATCTPAGRFALAQCAYLGRCAEWRYEDAVALFEPPELMDEARRLRAGILRALRDRDWHWLGLG